MVYCQVTVDDLGTYLARPGGEVGSTWRVLVYVRPVECVECKGASRRELQKRFSSVQCLQELVQLPQSTDAFSSQPFKLPVDTRLQLCRTEISRQKEGQANAPLAITLHELTSHSSRQRPAPTSRRTESFCCMQVPLFRCLGERLLCNGRRNR